jgi:hypothetical protein
VAGARWVIKECFELAKGGSGLDGYEVRSRSRLAPARDPHRVGSDGSGGDPLPDDGIPAGTKNERLIRVSVPELQDLLLPLFWSTIPPADQTLAWSIWCQRHQHRARDCDDKRRGPNCPIDHLRF